MKYKVGDTVQVSTTHPINKKCGAEGCDGLSFNDDMAKLRGQYAVIAAITEANNSYYLDIALQPGYMWAWLDCYLGVDPMWQLKLLLEATL
jgi:hypothetical protein